ncbi:hypothetical protein [Ornithinibacillus halophilus]|uniref:hypothetical protein n=1 Tax=Ornithinibacillus halophilus TaxID=930117 RepID=UPI0009355E77
MKQFKKIIFINIPLLLIILFLIGCGEEKEDSNLNTSENNLQEQSNEEANNQNNDEEENDSEQTVEKSETKTSQDEVTSDNSAEEQSNESSNDEVENLLSNYSSQEIEYARIWLQFGVIKDVDEINVYHIPAGTPLNPDDSTSASYPEDVIQLAGIRLVEGSITYSGNGDGTINIYNVPLRWDGEYPAGEEFYNEIIDNTKLKYVDPGDDEEVIQLIQVLNIHN